MKAEIRHDLSNAEYHGLPAIGKSGLDLMARSPAHFRYQAKNEQSRNMVLGTAAHMAILEPDKFSDAFVTLPDGVDRRSSAYKEAAAAKGADYVLTRSEADRIEGMASAVQGNKWAMDFLADGRPEVSVFADDPVTGVRCKVRPDWLASGGVIVDLKTTSDASDEGFGKSVANYRYHVQAAFYTDVYRWATGDVLPFRFLVVESDLPHGCTIMELPADVIEYGRRMYRRDLNLYAECLRNDVWPGIPGVPHALQLPSWFVAEMDAFMGDVEVTV